MVGLGVQLSGTVLESYAQDLRFDPQPCRMGWRDGIPLHLVEDLTDNVFREIKYHD